MKRIIIFICFFVFSSTTSEACITTNIINDTLCNTRRIFFNGAFRDTTGTYRDTLFNANSAGCDSIIILNLVVKSSVTILYDTFCQGDSVYFNGAWRKFNGTYRDTLPNSNGCDSFIFLQLRVNGPAYYGYPARRVCQNNLPFIFGDSSFTTGGLKLVTLRTKSRVGCDSIWWFNLTIDPVKSTTLNRTLCQGSSFYFKGQNRTGYPTSSNRVDSLTIKDTLVTSRGCDSIVTLNLKVYKIDSIYLDVTICDNQSYLFNSMTLTTAGFYRATYKNKFNCDSLVFLNLKVNRTSRFTYYRKYCSNTPLFFNGEYLNASGTYLDTLVNSQGCDSFLTMVLYKDMADSITINTSICQNDSLEFNNSFYKIAGTYVFNYKNKGGCDSIVTLKLSVYPTKSNPVISTYAPRVLISTLGYKYYQWFFNDNVLNAQTKHYLEVNKTGDYTITTTDSNGCVYSSAKYSYTYNSIFNTNPLSFEIYPNPARESITIKSSAIDLRNSNISVYSLEGKLIEKLENSNLSQVNINIANFKKGLYFVEIESNKMSYKAKFVKE
jgi:hypothetical protein